MFAGALILAAMPASSNYQLNNYSFGSGGVGNASSSNYRLNGVSGEVSGQNASSTNYSVKSGNNNVQQAHVPTAPTFTNPANYYNKLKLVIATANNASDAVYAISISSDNFATDTRFVKSDNTVGNTLTLADYQTYTAWGGASGFNIIGLQPSTTYTVKVKAMQGAFTETQYGPTAQAATVGPQISFSVSPTTEALGNLTAATVITSPSNVTATLSTNAEGGGNIYISGQNGGLNSPKTGTTITSATADLSLASTGFGVQSASATQTSGGPLSAQSPYNSSAQTVGLVDSTLRIIYQTLAPITNGQGSFSIKAKASSNTPAAADYAEVLTVVAAAIF